MFWMERVRWKWFSLKYGMVCRHCCCLSHEKRAPGGLLTAPTAAASGPRCGRRGGVQRNSAPLPHAL